MLAQEPGKIHSTLVVNNWCDWQTKLLTELKVVHVMRRSDFHNAGAKLHIHTFIGDNIHADWTEKTRNFERLANVFFIAFIIWIDGQGGVTELGFWPNSGNREWAILHVVQWVDLLSMIYFQF